MFLAILIALFVAWALMPGSGITLYSLRFWEWRIPTLLSNERGAATTDVINLFRYTYGEERLQYLAALEVVLYRILGKRKSPVGGRGQWIVPLQTQNGGVWVGNAEGGAKTTRRVQPASTEATFKLQEFHGIWDITWKMLQDARSDAYSFERGVEFMDESFRRRTLRALNADLCGTGRGELASIASAQNSTTPAVTSLPFCDQGMIIDWMANSDDNTKDATAVTVQAIDVQGRSLTLSGALSGSAGNDYGTIADSVSTATGSLHTFGIRAWLDKVNPSKIYQSGGSGNTGGGLSNLGGIDRTTAANIFWTASVLANGGTLRPLTEDLMLQGLDVTRERGGRLVTDYMSDLAIIRRYHESLRADTFFALTSIKELGNKIGLGRSSEEMTGGEDSEGETPYQFSGIPWRAEMFFAANSLIGFNREHFWIGHGENDVPRPIAEIFGEDMITYFTPTSNTTFEVVSYMQAQLLCDNPPAGFQIKDVAES